MAREIELNQSCNQTLINEVLVDFLQERSLVNNLSEQTIKTYGASAKRIIDVLELNYAEEVTSKKLNDFIVKMLLDYKVKEITVNSYLHNFSTFLSYLKEYEYVDEKVKINYVKADKPIKETYTKEEIQRLIEKPNIKKCHYVDLRSWAIVCFLLATGVRARTLRNIRVKDIDF